MEHFRTPFLSHWNAPKYIRDFLRVAYDAPPELRQVLLHKSSQVGFTSAIQAITAYGVVRGGKHVVIVQPTGQDATEFRRDSITPLFDGIHELELLGETVRRDQSTTSHRVFDSSSVRVQGGLNPSRWRRFVCDILCIDERDAMPWSATSGTDDEGEGDVLTLATRALQNRQGRLIAGGTPTSAQGASRIVAEARDAALPLVFVVQCPGCGAMDDLAWERIKWSDAKPETAEHECSHCGGRWLHAELANALEGGRWVQSQWEDDAPFPAPAKDGVWLDGEDGVLRDSNGERQVWPRSVGFALWGGYSPWRDWTEMVALWLQCQANPAKLQAFVEQQLAQPWTKATEAVGSTPTSSATV